MMASRSGFSRAEQKTRRIAGVNIKNARRLVTGAEDATCHPGAGEVSAGPIMDGQMIKSSGAFSAVDSVGSLGEDVDESGLAVRSGVAQSLLNFLMRSLSVRCFAYAYANGKGVVWYCGVVVYFCK